VRRILIGLTIALWAAPALAQTSLLPTVQRIRRDYPTPMSQSDKAELLNRVAWEHRAEGWGLLRKTGGNRCPAPQGVDVACDILVHAPTAWHYDVLVDQDNSATAAWINKGPCDPAVSGCAMSRFLAPIGPPGEPPPELGDTPVPGEYDGDGQIDVAVYRTTTGEWFIRQGTAARVVLWGAPSLGDVPVPADYDGDRRTDIAVYRTSTGQWFILNSSTGTLTQRTFGSASVAGLGDIPMAGDYDRDGRADLGLYRSATGEWFILRSSDGGLTYRQWGNASLGDIPVPGEYDGVVPADVAIYRTATGEWFISQPGSTRHLAWGTPSLGDVPVPADYDGDDRTDVAVYRASTGQWFILNSSTNTTTLVTFGSASAAGLRDTPLAGDYDQDGRADLAIYRSSTGEWFLRRSSDGGLVHIQWGAP
jgi:hypothetical protein